MSTIGGTARFLHRRAALSASKLLLPPLTRVSSPVSPPTTPLLCSHRLLQGDSQVAIRELGEERGAGGEFWYLDGHYSMLDTACGADASPILGELEFILGGRRGGLRSQDVIVIDDARTFRGDRLANNMWCPELASIQDRVCELDPGLLFYVEDDAAVVRRPTELERGWEEGELVWNVEGVGREAEGWRYKWEV